MENFKLHFNKDVPEKDKYFSEYIVGEEKKEGLKKITGEYEKSIEEVKTINLLNNLVQKEIKNLGIEPREKISPDRIHFINDLISKDWGISGNGSFGVVIDSIFINKDSLFDNKIILGKTIIHEMIHYYSANSVIVMGEEIDLKVHRSGYRIGNHNELNHEHFRGFNEAVVEKIIQDILSKNKEQLIDELKISNTEVEESNDKYISGDALEIEILDTVIFELSKFYNKEQSEIWTKIKKGMFTGEMMHLRDIEKAFGPGSLRVLASMSSNGSTKKMKDIDLFDKLNDFFETDNQETRDKLAKQILSERERLQYKRNKEVENKYAKS